MTILTVVMNFKTICNVDKLTWGNLIAHINVALSNLVNFAQACSSLCMVDLGSTRWQHRSIAYECTSHSSNIKALNRMLSKLYFVFGWFDIWISVVLLFMVLLIQIRFQCEHDLKKTKRLQLNGLKRLLSWDIRK